MNQIRFQPRGNKIFFPGDILQQPVKSLFRIQGVLAPAAKTNWFLTTPFPAWRLWPVPTAGIPGNWISCQPGSFFFSGASAPKSSLAARCITLPLFFAERDGPLFSESRRRPCFSTSFLGTSANIPPREILVQWFFGRKHMESRPAYWGEDLEFYPGVQTAQASQQTLGPLPPTAMGRLESGQSALVGGGRTVSGMNFVL